jgi:hypothetical protein
MERCGLRVEFESHTHTPGNVKKCEGMSPHIPKWIVILELESLWSFEFSENNLRGQNSLD